MNKIIAVDFDGTLCVNKWPEIGDAKTETINYLKKRKDSGDKLILWTCRVGEMLSAAVSWCVNQGLEFDAVNENLPEIVESFGSDTRKIFANEYLDDRNVFVEDFKEKSETQLWAEKEVEIACQMVEEGQDNSDHMRNCYDSALKSYSVLLRDGHSGISMGFTKAIFNRLTDKKPLTPIEDVPDNWTDVTETLQWPNIEKVYQCKRMPSLFKSVYADRVVYEESHRCYCIDEFDRPCDSAFARDIINAMYPIVMPYMPADKPYKVKIHKADIELPDGDFKLFALFHIIEPSGYRVEFNRFFQRKNSENAPWEEITEKEYRTKTIQDTDESTVNAKTTTQFRTQKSLAKDERSALDVATAKGLREKRSGRYPWGSDDDPYQHSGEKH